MLMKKSISVCIPVFGSEPYLEACLKSVAEQTFRDYEVIVVNDGSSGTDADGNNCKKIIKNCKKKYKLPVNYIQHSKNKGLLEARRTAVYAAKGDYIFNLDSDDRLPPDALSVLYRIATETGADIIHGKGKLFAADGNEQKVEISREVLESIRKDKSEKIEKVYLGTIESSYILDSYLVKHNHCGFLWGKLFSRELYLEAFDKIPPMFCTMAEDVIQYFWITYFGKKYVGIEDCVYYYCDDTGVTSRKVIDNLDKWEQVCSVASVFTAFYTSLGEYNIELKEAQKNSMSLLCCNYVVNNLMQLRQTVIPELKEEAYNILCDYWGKGLVSRIELKLNNKS